LVFWGFNAVMAFWLFGYWSSISPVSGDAAKAGQAVGVTLATGMVLFFWAAGALITGLFVMLTRGRRTYIEEHID
jgi:hypothetical protein